MNKDPTIAIKQARGRIYYKVFSEMMKTLMDWSIMVSNYIIIIFYMCL